ncbi:SAM-dependent methyltransferase [Streptomyces pratens]|uniref:SAM-dependent methyltransferase n=1 Tax=Streptomyces pratens TaxID=887456 RepID=A0ABW1LS26_9ACTN
MGESHTRPRGSTRPATSVAHNARVWNHRIGGKDTYEVGRQAGDRVASIIPVIRDIARADREFLGRAVTCPAGERGVRQFLDVGPDYVEADAHDSDAILERAPGTLDFDRPVAVMTPGTLTFVLDTEVGGEDRISAMEFWNENAAPPITARGAEDVFVLLEGLNPVEPGPVSCSQGHARAGSAPVVPQYGVVAVKP